MAIIKINLASDENDDWMKKGRKGYRKQERAAHKWARDRHWLTTRDDTMGRDREAAGMPGPMRPALDADDHEDEA